MTIAEKIKNIAAERILVLDGAMGTMIQTRGLSEADFRGPRFADWAQDVRGNNDLLNITQPDLIRQVHDTFLEVGADIIETNSFNATSVSQADYGMGELVAEINESAARIAREAADAWTAKTPDKPRFVAGAVGPTSKTLSVSPDVNDPGHRDITFDELVEAYQAQIAALIRGGVDLLLIETIFDTLNAKAAIFAAQEAFDAAGRVLPLMLSCTVTDLSGRNLSGQTIEAFWYSVRHARPLTVGLNCAFGAEELRAPAAQLARIADCLVCIYPNAGLPNEMGDYDETPDVTSGHLGDWAREGLVNFVGGCCGTTPEHIRAIADAVEGVAPRALPNMPAAMRLSGLEGAVFTASGEGEAA